MKMNLALSKIIYISILFVLINSLSDVTQLSRQPAEGFCNAGGLKLPGYSAAPDVEVI